MEAAETSKGGGSKKRAAERAAEATAVEAVAKAATQAMAWAAARAAAWAAAGAAVRAAATRQNQMLNDQSHPIGIQ